MLLHGQIEIKRLSVLLLLSFTLMASEALATKSIEVEPIQKSSVQQGVPRSKRIIKPKIIKPNIGQQKLQRQQSADRRKLLRQGKITVPKIQRSRIRPARLRVGGRKIRSSFQAKVKSLRKGKLKAPTSFRRRTAGVQTQLKNNKRPKPTSTETFVALKTLEDLTAPPSNVSAIDALDTVDIDTPDLNSNWIWLPVGY